MAGTEEGPVASTSSGSDDEDTTAQPDPTSAGLESTGQDASSTGDPVGDFDRGRVVFNETCGRDACHGPDGASGPAPNLAVVVLQRDDVQLRSVIQLGTGNTGKSEGSMPGLELEEQDLADVIVYLRATFGG